MNAMLPVEIKPDKVFNYANSPSRYFAKMGLHIIPAIVLGIVVNKSMTALQNRFKLGPWSMIIIQIMVLIIVCYIIETKISKKFSFEWQNITPGLFFVSIFFGLQTNLFANLNIISKQ